jgi:hypothetical protein
MIMIAGMSAAAAMLSGCGGSGGGDGSASTQAVRGTVQASILKGVNVCVKDTDKCDVTDKTGAYEIQGVTLPVNLVLKVGESLVGAVAAKSTQFDITPKVLAAGDEKVAARIGSVLHKIGTPAGGEVVDLSAVKEVANVTGSLVDEIKKDVKNGEETKLKVITKEGKVKDHTVTSQDDKKYALDNPGMVAERISYKGGISDGKAVAFTFDPEKDTVEYQIGAMKGTLEIQNLYKNFVYKDKKNNKYFFSGSVAAGAVDDSLVVGIQTFGKNDPKVDVYGKEFALALMNDDEDDEVTLCQAFFFKKGDQRVALECSDDYSAEFTWTEEADNVIKFQGDGKTGMLYLRASADADGRSSLVGNLQDYVIMGAEAKPITDAELNGASFVYYAAGEDNDKEWYCYGDATVKGTKLEHKDAYCSDGDTGSGSATLTLNPVYNGQELNGFVKVTEEDGEVSFGMFDPSNGYFIMIPMNGDEIVVGSDKAVK